MFRREKSSFSFALKRISLIVFALSSSSRIIKNAPLMFGCGLVRLVVFGFWWLHQVLFCITKSAPIKTLGWRHALLFVDFFTQFVCARRVCACVWLWWAVAVRLESHPWTLNDHANSLSLCSMIMSRLFACFCRLCSAYCPTRVTHFCILTHVQFAPRTPSVLCLTFLSNKELLWIVFACVKDALIFCLSVRVHLP